MEGSFSLLVAFGRCHFRLEDHFVVDTLSSLVGGPAESFQVCLGADRVFLFLVSCKKVAFEIYNLYKFSCLEFELSFHLFNVAGLVVARLFIDGKPQFFWIEVGEKFPPTEAVHKRAKNPTPGNFVLTGANDVPVRQEPSMNSVPLRSSVFERIEFPRVPVAKRLQYSKRSAQSGHSVKLNWPAPNRLQVSSADEWCRAIPVHSAVQGSRQKSLDLDLNLGPLSAVMGNSF